MARTNTTGSAGPGSGTVTSVDGVKSVVATPSPITGAGTLELVNDQSAPGANMLYGTDPGGVKGWQPIPPNAGIISLTYIALDALINSSSLTPGQFYEINDFQTICTVPGNFSAVHYGTQEPLIVQAITKNTLAEQVWSTIHSEDIIYYDFIDGTSANPGVLIPNGNMGRINYRESTDSENRRSTYYDFRECVFYHPNSRYDFTGVPFPITLNSVDINGFPSIIGTTINDLDELEAYFATPSSGWFMLPRHLSLSDLFNIFSLNGAEWGNMNITDALASTYNIVPTITQDFYYTFGNTIQVFGGHFIPASDGNARAKNVHVGPCSDGWSGQVMNNVIFPRNIVDWFVGTETINGVIGDSGWDGRIGNDCYIGFVVGDASVGVQIGDKLSYDFGSAYTLIGNFAQALTIGNENIFNIRTPDNFINCQIGDGMSYSFEIDLLNSKFPLVTANNRFLTQSESNMDIASRIDGAFQLNMIEWAGIVYADDAITSSVKKVIGYPTTRPFKVFKKGTTVTFDPIVCLPANGGNVALLQGTGAPITLPGKYDFIELSVLYDLSNPNVYEINKANY